MLNNTPKYNEALEVAKEFVERYKRADVVGIVFLGALARGYFDKYADIDISILKGKNSKIKSIPVKYVRFRGYEIDYAVNNFEDASKTEWTMAGRWAHSQAMIYYDPDGLVKKLIQKKCKLSAKERRWLMIEGTTQSEWYGNDLPKVWIHRKDLLSAHSMFFKAIDHFLDALFALNNRLVPDHKWKLNSAMKLEWLPKDFRKRVNEVLRVSKLDEAELRRRSRDFMHLWKQLKPKVEKEVNMRYEKFRKLV